MKILFAVVLISISLSACSPGYNSQGSAAAPGDRQLVSLSSQQKHQLYSAALAVSENPLDSDVFKSVCQKIGIFGPGGSPNEDYLPFVSAHVDWALRAETQNFKREINTREKAGSYVTQHLPR
jgi:hypothetical protein